MKSVVNGETFYFAGGHYEMKGNEIAKYYFAGASRVAMRKTIVPQSDALTYLLGDHLGSTSLAVDASTGDVVETRYKPWGEVRYTTENLTLPTRYTFTGQYSHMSDDATDLGAAGFGLMFYNARWYDPMTGRFAQADSIVPGGVQGLDRYAYVGNNPVNYIDPSGHETTLCDETCEEELDKPQYTLDEAAEMYGVEFNGTGWTWRRKVAAIVAVYKIAKALQKEINAGLEADYQSCLENMSGPSSTCTQSNSLTPTDAFKKIYRAGVNLIWGCSFCSKLAYTGQSKSTIYFRDMYGDWRADEMLRNMNLVIHELGHMFDNLYDRVVSASLTANLANNRDGFGAADVYQQSTDINSVEIFADMFVHWIQGGWDPRYDIAVNQRVEWLNENMPGYIQ